MRSSHISPLPLADAEKLVESIQAKGAKLAIPGIVDLSEMADESNGVAKIVLESVQKMLLKIAPPPQMARDDWETRRERQMQGIEIAKAQGRYLGRRADVKNPSAHQCASQGRQRHRQDCGTGRLLHRAGQADLGGASGAAAAKTEIAVNP